MHTDVARALNRFVAWLDRHGPLSQDHLDLFATRIGKRAKSLYHSRAVLGAPAVAPFVAVDAVAPRLRRYVQPSRRFPIADAHYALGFFALARQGGGEELERAEQFLAALEQERCAGYDDLCWGFPLDWQTCIGTLPAGLPLITQTPYGYEAFEAAHAVSGDHDHLERMRSVARFAFAQIPTTPLAPGVAVCAYTPRDRRRVINANAYRAFLLTAAGTRFGCEEWLRAGDANLAFVLREQREDGSWPYAVDGYDDFVDNFHTCFVLKNLLKVWRITRENRVLDAVRHGYAFYKESLLDRSGEPVPFHRASRPVLFRRDLYDYAEGINLALLAREIDPDAGSIADRLVKALLEDWLCRDGHFATRRLLVGWNRVPYHRWAQAQTFHALARYAAAE